MNIFFLSADPEEAAKMACDRHSIKMILESAQMLSTVLRQHGYDGETYIYGMTHVKHPSTIWAGKTLANFEWLLSHSLAYAENTPIDTESSIKVRKSCFVVVNCEINISPQVL